MPKGTTASNEILALVLNATAIANIADNAASSPLTNLYVALHTSNPGAGGTQLTNEGTVYTNYARVAVARTTGGWVAPSGGASSNTALIQFPTCGASGATITHVSIGTAASGAGKILYFGALNSSLAVANLIQPQFNANDLDVTEA
jgi:hypothetical protein